MHSKYYDLYIEIFRRSAGRTLVTCDSVNTSKAYSLTLNYYVSHSIEVAAGDVLIASSVMSPKFGFRPWFALSPQKAPMMTVGS